MNRTFLFLLLVGLFMVVWHRNHSRQVTAPVAKPAVVAPTNATGDRGLVSVKQSIHK
jgi:hypothetical protein